APNSGPKKDNIKELPDNNLGLTIGDTFVAEVEAIIPPLRDHDNHPHVQVYKRMMEVISANSRLYYNDHPEYTTKKATEYQKTDDGNPQKPSKRAKHEGEPNKSEPTGHGTAFATDFLKIFGVQLTKEYDPDQYASYRTEEAKISQEFLEALNHSTSSQRGQALRNALDTFAHKRALSNDYLPANIDFPHIATYLATLIFRGKWKSTAMSEEQGLIKQQISIMMFKPAPIEAFAKSHYDKYISGNYLTEQEDEVEETSKNRTKMSTECFVDGREGTFEDVITTIANLDCFFAFTWEWDDDDNDKQPTIVSFLRLLANQIRSKDVQKWIKENIATAPWIPAQLLSMIHSIIICFVRVAIDPQMKQHLTDDTELPYIAFSTCIDQFTEVTKNLNNAVRSETLGVFHLPPKHWKITAPNKTKDEKMPATSGVTTSTTSKPNDGWLAFTAPQGHIELPKELSVNLCITQAATHLR
ncbi:MAG: hypothetical protein ACRDL7_05500, partial [Gaiellaceae bacterium]